MLNVFIPHRWNNDDYTEISSLLDRTRFKVRDYSVPSWAPFDAIDRRYNLDPLLQRQIKYASVVVCSNRPANNNGMAMDEIKYALSIGKPVVAVRITDNTSTAITSLGIPVVTKRKDGNRQIYSHLPHTSTPPDNIERLHTVSESQRYYPDSIRIVATRQR